MQVLKQEVYDKIIEVATNEFYEKGYLDASMRKIAKLSGITVGNIYRYFSSKADLFESIVIEPYQIIIELIKKTDREVIGITEEERFDYSINSLLKICQSFNRIIIIILTKAKGSKYENVYGVVRESIIQRVKLEIDLLDDDLAEIMTESTLGAITHLLAKYDSDPKKMLSSMQKAIKYIFGNLNSRLE